MVTETLIPSAEIYFRLARFFLVLVIGTILTRIVLMPGASKIVGVRKGDKKALESVTNIAGVIGLFLSFILALQAAQFGNLVTVLGVISAALTVAIGFGMREQISNLVGGFLIYTDNPFLKGDYIKVNDTEGSVKKIKLRYTELNGKSSEKILLPNSVLTLNAVRNFTKKDKSKTVIDFKIEVDKLEKLERIVFKQLEQNEKILKKPESESIYQDITEGKVEVRFTYWVRDSDNLKKIRSDVLRQLNKESRFRKIVKSDDK